MESRSRFLDDLAKIASSTASTIAGMKDEAENLIKQRVEALMNDMNLVTREEFEVMNAMLRKARLEQEKLIKRIEALEKPSSKQKAKRPRKKSAAAKKSLRKKAAVAKKSASKK
jgi:BMFP domain-containing protein YqiC|tara:strand:- start:769 stop:1110 length:342 start_codon:yes stop_codon:yes gene_type:complete